MDVDRVLATDSRLGGVSTFPPMAMDVDSAWPPCWPPARVSSPPPPPIQPHKLSFAEASLLYAEWRSVEARLDISSNWESRSAVEKSVFTQVDSLWNEDCTWASKFAGVFASDVAMQLLEACLDPADADQVTERRLLRLRLVEGKKVKQPQILIGNAPFSPPPKPGPRVKKCCFFTSFVQKL